MQESVSALRAIGIHVYALDANQYRFCADDGFCFEMPGVPLGQRERYTFGGRHVPAYYFDLDAEESSRAYLLRVFDVRALDDQGREEARARAHADIARAAGHASDPRSFLQGETRVHELDLYELDAQAEHDATLRTLVLRGFVFQAVVVAEHGSGDAADTRRFFGSLRVQERPD